MSHGHRLILVKHSLPEIVENVPAHMWELSNVGHTNAKVLAEKLIQYNLDAIISSMEPKALQTAAILAENLGIEFFVMDGLHEHERSGALFYSKDIFQSHVRELFEKPDELVFGKETAAQALDRFRRSVESALESHGNKSVAVVAHGTVISLFVSWLTGVDGYLLWKDLGLPSIVVLDAQNRKLLEVVNIN